MCPRSFFSDRSMLGAIGSMRLDVRRRTIGRVDVMRGPAGYRIHCEQPSFDLLEWNTAGLRRALGKTLRELRALPKFARFAFKRIRCLKYILLAVLTRDLNAIVSDAMKQLIERYVLALEVYGPRKVTFFPWMNNCMIRYWFGRLRPMSIHWRVCGSHCALLVSLAAVALTFAPSGKSAGPQSVTVAANQSQMDSWWIDLEKGEAEASRALLDLCDHAQEAVPFLKDKLRPLTISSGQVKALLLKLNSPDEHLWKPAFAELEYFDPRLAIELPELMERVTESPARQRMVEVLSEREPGSLKDKQIDLSPVGDGFNFFSQGVGSWWAEPKVSKINSYRWSTFKRKWTRAQRAIVLLEQIGTPEAASILKAMATGHPEAVPTKLAKDSLARLKAAKRPLESCWDDLEKGAAEASRASLELYSRAPEAVALLKDKLKPLTITSGQVKALLLKLNSADEHLWKSAFAELEYFDPRLAIGLEELMDRVTESPGRQRMVAVLSERDPAWLDGKEIKLRRGAFFNFFTDRSSWWAENRVSEINGNSWGIVKRKWTRAERAIVLLEHIHTPEAISILKEMATGHAEARPTVIAKEALARIDGKVK